MHHLVFRGILQDDPFFFIKKIEGRYCAYIIQLVVSYDEIRIKAVIPVFRMTLFSSSRR